MKRGRVIAASAAFVGLTLTKMLFPGAGETARERLRAALVREPDAVAGFRDLGRRLSLRREEPQAAAAVAPTPEDAPRRIVSYYVEDAAVTGETEAPEPEADPEQNPAVAAFLERQAAFPDHPLPENVEALCPALPFDYALPVAGRQSSGFGYRRHPILDVVRFHYGTDIAAWTGETVTAFAAGRVIFAGYDDSYGWHLRIDHGDGWQTHYCHCSALLAEEGQSVARGDRIALVGATGLATGPHLHFELTHDGVYLNPEYYINL